MIAYLVRHRAPVILVVICIFLFGLWTYIDLPRESFPDVDIPVVMVTTPYVGVAPEDIESLITIPIENELTGVKDLKKMSSTSAEGVSIIALEFEPDAAIEEAIQGVRDRVSRARPELPEDAEETNVQEVSISDFPIMIIALSGDLDEEQLKRLGEDLEDDLNRVDGVLEAKLAGGRTRQIRVQVDPIRLAHYSLSMDNVIDAISNENVNIPGGDVGAGDANFLVRVPGEFTDAHELEDVAVKRVGDRPVFVRDVATVVDGFADRESYSRVNGESAVTISVSKRTGANILEVAESVKALIAEHAEGWPDAVTWRVVGDQSRDIRSMVSDLQNNVITALILVVLVILFFMGVRNSLFVAVAIPLSMLMGTIFIAAFGMTLNMVVLFALILVLGMLVDNAIVLVENIYRHVEDGKDLVEASVTGAKEIGLAVAASTATTVVAFAPLVFWTGIMGEFMGYMPKTVIIVLICSLAVAIGILPVLTARLMRVSKKPGGGLRNSALMQRYRRLLERSIDHRYWVTASGVLMLVGTVVAYIFLNHGTEFFPEVEPDRAVVVIRAPDGTDIEATDGIARQVEGVLAAERNVDFYVVETGVVGGGDPMAGAQTATNQARITIDFLPHDTKAEEGQTPRHEQTGLTIERIRTQFAQIAGADIRIEKERMGPPVGKPISVEVSGPDFHAVGELAARTRRELAEIPGTTGLTDNYRVGRPEMRLRIDRAAAKRVGASTRAVAGAVRTAVAGSKASTLRDGEKEYDIIVELSPEYRQDLQSIMALNIPGREDTSPDTFSVPISSVASYSLAGGSGSIRHIDQDLVVTIEGDVAEGFNENEVREAVETHIAAADAPDGLNLRLGGAQDEQQESQAFLLRAFLIALCLIVFVLVAQFNSFSVPMIIIASVVLSLVGVLWGLILTGTSFGVIMTGIGVISLAGVVVNNAIVLLDYVEQLRREGMPVRQALIEAGVTRFRPVILTALTTVLGLVPMAIGVSFDFIEFELIVGSQNSAFWGPMAVAIIFGLVFATVLTLIAVPTMYGMVEDLRPALARMLPWGVGATTPKADAPKPDVPKPDAPKPAE